MTIDQAVALLVGRTKHGRFLELAKDPANHAALIRLAGGSPADPGPGPEPTYDEVLAVAACPHRECREGCRMTRCLAGRSPRRDGTVAVLDCLRCLRAR